jgi:hypothetical protein
MADPAPDTRDVDQFVLDEIDSVPHLEALLLIWNNRPKAWSSEEMARSLYVHTEIAQRILRELVQRQLLSSAAGNPETFVYASEPGRDRLLQATDATYRRQVVRLSNLIHSKASPAVRDFARAFRFTKDRE